MSIAAINNVVEKMHQQINHISAPTTHIHAAAENNKGDFKNIFFNSLSDISAMQKEAQNISQSHLIGAEHIGMNDVMISLQKSSIALNFGVQVRNKIVSAYQEIMNISV